MPKYLIFGGTQEGRKVALECLAKGDETVVCVTTRYGKDLLPDGITVYDHPMNADEMVRVAQRHDIEAIIDATHPFAIAASQNINACAKELALPYHRVIRSSDENSDFSPYVTWVKSAEEAVKLLLAETGPVLLTTGSNTLSIYAKQIDLARLYVRVLPTVKAIEQCESAGVLPGHIIAMQGPFSIELNGAIYDQFAIRHVVSKDSGDVGGVREKVLPALKRNLNVLIIKRPEGKD